MKTTDVRFCFDPLPYFMEWSLISINYKLLIIFQQVDIYLNEPIKIDEHTKLANQLTQRRTRHRNDKNNNN